MLAHNCSVMEVGVNFDRLYSGADPDYELSLRVLVDRVGATREEAARR